MEMPDLFNQPTGIPSQSFHNTNMDSDITGSEDKASKQEDIVLEMFKSNPDAEFSAEDILGLWNKAGHNAVPLTSIRRAISNLTFQLLIVKTINQKVGMYGKKIFTWTNIKF